MNKQKKYWDRKIKIWSQSSYKRKVNHFDPLEYLAGFFRGPITRRMEVCLKFVGPRVKEKIIADFGCGVGDFCFKILSFKPKKVLGLDISSVAIKFSIIKKNNMHFITNII